MSHLFDEFSETLVLIRLFATVPFSFLPEREKRFAVRVASEHECPEELTDSTTVVALAATRGTQPHWNDPANSRSRLAVPLLGSAFVATIPLVGRVMSGMLTDVPWMTKQETLIVKEATGKMSSLLLVEDARTETAGDGSKAVVDQQFVHDHGVRTVMTLGGHYLNGTCVALVLFTTEHLTWEQASKFTTLLNTIKTATMKAVMNGRILEAPAAEPKVSMD